MKYIVTGCSNGIGRCICLTLLKNNHEVYGIDIDKKGKDLEDINEKFHFYRVDIGDKKELDSFLKNVEYIRFDGIINNAGFNSEGLDSCSYDEFNYALKVGLSAPFYLVKSLRYNLNKDASIVNIASTRALMSQKNNESYATVKGGILALTHAMAMTLRNKARVNSISPGWIDVSNYNESKKIEISNNDMLQHPVGRVGKPEDIAEMVLFMCSDKGSFINGENIVIDGGMSKQMIYHNDDYWKYKGE